MCEDCCDSIAIARYNKTVQSKPSEKNECKNCEYCGKIPKNDVFKRFYLYDDDPKLPINKRRFRYVTFCSNVHGPLNWIEKYNIMSKSRVMIGIYNNWDTMGKDGKWIPVGGRGIIDDEGDDDDDGDDDDQINEDQEVERPAKRMRKSKSRRSDIYTFTSSLPQAREKGPIVTEVD
jgi:hypothetical protein